MIKILITAGGTSEKIDDVRRITNSGTGMLGAKIAEAFAAGGRECAVTYICSENAVRPRLDAETGASFKALVCDDVNAVKDGVYRACSETAYDVIVHSMAIGDYRVKAILDSLDSQQVIKESKISSDREELVVVLEKAPKIIAMLRGLAPDAVIVGFKLLSGVSEEVLRSAGHALLEKNDCDFVFANDMRTVRSDLHEGILIAKDGTFERASGKDGIAALIAERTLRSLLGQ